MSTYRFIISGGGTGGHIFPAISIANELKARYPGCDILFVGALGRMEMERVPQAGYPIEGLPVQGFDRKRLWRNFKVLVNLVRSTRRARLRSTALPTFFVAVSPNRRIPRRFFKA